MIDLYASLNDSSTTGIKLIDDEHKLIITLFNDLRQIGKTNKDLLLNYINLFIKQFIFHCLDEEDFMKKIGYPELNKHRVQHQSLIRIFEGLKATIETEISDSYSVFNFYLFFIGHVLISDILIRDYYFDNNLHAGPKILPSIEQCLTSQRQLF